MFFFKKQTHEKQYYLDLNEEKCTLLAKKPLIKEDEDFAKEMVALINAAKKSKDYLEDEKVNPRAREIGKFLCRYGGHWRMVLVARRAEVLADCLRECEILWSHICGWMS